MFTGIIENMSEVVEVKQNKNNLDVIFKSDLISELKIDQSISHNGVCLTIADIYDNTYLVISLFDDVLGHFGEYVEDTLWAC